MSVAKLKGLYAITLSGDIHVVANVKAALAGGASVIQYRDKSSTQKQKLFIASELKALCDGRALFIINDDIELAKKVDADGVHIGKSDVSVSQARQLLGDKIIGVSCYNQLSLAEKAQQAGVDYVAFGRFFSSKTKPSAVQALPELLAEAKATLSVPIVAIGGITVNNAHTLIQNGADAIAVINGLFASENSVTDITKTAQNYCAVFQKFKR